MPAFFRNPVDEALEHRYLECAEERLARSACTYGEVQLAGGEEIVAFRDLQRAAIAYVEALERFAERMWDKP